MIEIPKELALKLIIDFEDIIDDYVTLHSNTDSSTPEYKKYSKIKKNLFELKKLYLKNR